jgi:hypothetical protein
VSSFFTFLPYCSEKVRAALDSILMGEEHLTRTGPDGLIDETVFKNLGDGGAERFPG